MLALGSVSTSRVEGVGRRASCCVSEIAASRPWWEPPAPLAMWISTRTTQRRLAVDETEASREPDGPMLPFSSLRIRTCPK